MLRWAIPSDWYAYSMSPGKRQRRDPHGRTEQLWHSAADTERSAISDAGAMNLSHAGDNRLAIVGLKGMT